MSQDLFILTVIPSRPSACWSKTFWLLLLLLLYDPIRWLRDLLLLMLPMLIDDAGGLLSSSAHFIFCFKERHRSVSLVSESMDLEFHSTLCHHLSSSIAIDYYVTLGKFKRSYDSATYWHSRLPFLTVDRSVCLCLLCTSLPCAIGSNQSIKKQILNQSCCNQNGLEECTASILSWQVLIYLTLCFIVFCFVFSIHIIANLVIVIVASFHVQVG